MQITINIKDYGDLQLYVIPLNDNKGDGAEYIVVYSDKDIGNPYLHLKLQNQQLQILSQHDIAEASDDLNEKLRDLAERIVVAIMNGEDLAAVNLTRQKLEKPYNPALIRVDTKNFSLKQVYDMILSGDMDLSPDFQRNLVWDSFRKSRLIESILLRIPLPMFYFSQDIDGKLYVVDGLQRLNAIKEFMDNQLVLKNLEYLQESCEGKTYSGSKRIDAKYFRWFNLTQITANVIDAQSPSKVKFDIFGRINTGGRPLNNQELRNSLSKESLRKALKEMSHCEEFKKATGGSVHDTRMEAQELALRFLFFRFYYRKDPTVDKYTGNMDQDLNDFVEFHNNNEDLLDMGNEVDAFKNAMRIAYYLFGRQAFRKVYPDTTEDSQRSVINKALFVSWSVVLADLDFDYIRSEFKRCQLISVLGKAIDEDMDYFNALSYGTNGKANIQMAFKKARKILKIYDHECPVKIRTD